MRNIKRKKEKDMKSKVIVPLCMAAVMALSLAGCAGKSAPVKGAGEEKVLK